MRAACGNKLDTSNEKELWSGRAWTGRQARPSAPSFFWQFETAPMYKQRTCPCSIQVGYLLNLSDWVISLCSLSSLVVSSRPLVFVSRLLHEKHGCGHWALGG